MTRGVWLGSSTSKRAQLALAWLSIFASMLASPAGAQPTAAWADKPTRVTLVQDVCASYNAEELAEILEVELRGIGVQELVVVPKRSQPPRPIEAGLALIYLSCDIAGTALTVQLADFATGNQLKRELSFTGLAAEARPRALALAIAVLVETSWIEVATRPRGSHEALMLPLEVRAALRERITLSLYDNERPRSPQPTAAKLDVSDNLFALLVEGRSFPSRSTALLGLQLAYMPRVGPVSLWLSADAAMGTSSLSDANGTFADVRLYWMSAAIGALWTSETQPALGLGPYARLGYAMAKVKLDPSFADYSVRDGSSVVAILGVQALLRAALTKRTFALIAVDLGYAVGGVLFLAESRPGASLADFSIGLRLGLAR